MSPKTVFVNLWFAETQQQESLGFVTRISDDKPFYVSDLRQEIKAKLANKLSHCDAAELAVLKPGVKAGDVIERYPVPKESVQPYNQILELRDEDLFHVIAPKRQSAAAYPPAIAMTNDITLWPNNDTSLGFCVCTKRLDCESLFAPPATKSTRSTNASKYKLKSTNNILVLSNLKEKLKRPNMTFDFLPDAIYIRPCMQELFHEVVSANNPSKHCVIFGSPGVGKSVLSFLAALCFACYETKDKGVMFLRKTERQDERTSVFWIRRESEEPTELTISFCRMVDKALTLPLVRRTVLRNMVYPDQHAYTNFFGCADFHIRTICDGPRYKDKDDYVHNSDSVTSGGFKPPKSEELGTLCALPLSAWTQEEVIKGTRALFHVTAADARKYYYVGGGNIRAIVGVIKDEDSDNGLAKLRKSYEDIVLKEAGNVALSIAVQSTELTNDKDSVDRLRSLFGVQRTDKAGYDTFMFVASPFILRLIRSKLDLDGALALLALAKSYGNPCLYGWHFEMFGHCVFDFFEKQQARGKDPNRAAAEITWQQFKVMKIKGKTAEQSVKELMEPLCYWTPSVFNFANIDGAIAVGSNLYCIQYTVSTSHTFNCMTFQSRFWSVLSPRFRESIEKIFVVFVVPHNITFTKVVIPKKQEKLCEHFVLDNLKAAYVKPRVTMEVDGEEGELFPDGLLDDDQDEEGFEAGPGTLEKLLNGPLQTIEFKWEHLNVDKATDSKAPLTFMKKNK